MNLRELYIRMRLRPAKDDIQYVAEKWIREVEQTDKGVSLSEILTMGFPSGSWRAMILDAFNGIATKIATGENRRKQASIVREILLSKLERQKLLGFAMNGGEIRMNAWLSHRYSEFPDWTDSDRKAALSAEWAMESLQLSVIKCIYLSQYNKTLPLDQFDEIYSALCVAHSEIAINSLVAETDGLAFLHPVAAAYQEMIFSPIEPMLAKLRASCAEAIIIGRLKSIHSARQEAIQFADLYRRTNDNFIEYLDARGLRQPSENPSGYY